MDEDMQYACDLIRSTVSSIDTGRALGLNPRPDGRCKCPFHGGDHMNLKLYGPGRGYYCFVCHAHGDVIQLVKDYTQCSFAEAVEWISDAFGLKISFRRNTPWRRRRKAEAYARKVAGGRRTDAKQQGRNAKTESNP